MITLSKPDTLQIIMENNRFQSISEKYSFAVKYPWKCLHCLTDIFISYKQFSNIAIFCDNCKNEANDSSKEAKLIQMQFMRRVKEAQYNLINSFFEGNENENKNQ